MRAARWKGQPGGKNKPKQISGVYWFRRGKRWQKKRAGIALARKNGAQKVNADENYALAA